MTYNVLMGTLNPTHSLTQYSLDGATILCWRSKHCWRLGGDMAISILISRYITWCMLRCRRWPNSVGSHNLKIPWVFFSSTEEVMFSTALV